MSLPELTWQIVYGRLAWALVIAALVCTLWPPAWRLPRRTAAALLLATAALQALPGAASPAYWLGLAFQWPSAALALLCALKLYRTWQGDGRQPALTPPLAMGIALVGLVLYLDAMGVLALGLYSWGFGPTAAPVTALLLAAACTGAAIVNRARGQALALLMALTLFAVLRLPTGNLWDALLDPLLWGWSLFSLAVRWWRTWALQRRPRAVDARSA